MRRPGRKAGEKSSGLKRAPKVRHSRSAGPSDLGLEVVQVPALAGGAIHCRAFGPGNRTRAAEPAKCPNSRRQLAAATCELATLRACLNDILDPDFWLLTSGF